MAQSEFGHKVFFKIDIQLSLGQKRILYFDKATEREKWTRALRSALGEEGRRISDHYDYGDKLLGQGSFGKVYKGVNKVTQQEVAIKVLNKKGLTLEDLEYQMNELGILKACHSRHICAILDFFEDANHMYIVQEFIDGFNLMAFYKGVPRIELASRKIMQGLAEGLQYLHSIGIAHRDIKLENIMLSIDG